MDINGDTSSYPTYEEWKPSLSIPATGIVEGSYPTYEEWKLRFTFYF